jgi:hypothetical protein
MLLLLTKAQVAKPGSRGGHPWINERGEWEYGPRPKGKTRRQAYEQEQVKQRKQAQEEGKTLPHSSRRVMAGPKSPQQYSAAIDALANNTSNIHNLASNAEEWRQHQLIRLGEPAKSHRKVAFPPSLAMQWAHDGGAGVREMFNKMDPAVREEAVVGLGHVERNMRLAKNHALTPRAVLLHFVWAILAKSSEPYTQESAYIDLEHSGINYFIDKAIAGKFDLNEYKQWLGKGDSNVLIPDAGQRGFIHRPDGVDAKRFKGLSQGSPGRGVTMNVNTIGTMLDDWSKRGTKDLTDVYTNPDISGQEARRQFWKQGYGGGGIGLNNKILSFATAMLGKPDVMVMDIWQGRRFHAEDFDRLWHEHHRQIVAENGGKETDSNDDGSLTKATWEVTAPYNSPGGPSGLAAYEGLESLLAEAVKGLPVDKNGLIEGKVTPSIFALHWLSWVANFGAAVGHHSLDTVQNLNEAGLSSRAQDRSEGLKGTPTADDELSNLAATQVTEGSNTTRNYLTTYRRGELSQEDVVQRASLVPTEFMPGSLPSDLKIWLSKQTKDVQSAFSRGASQRLEPLFRKLAAQRGLALSVNEGYGGFAGDGNANTQATLVALDKNWTPEQTEAAVRAFSADMGWALYQDMAAYGHVVPPGAPNSRTGYDFQLNRSLTPVEAAGLGRNSLLAMQAGLDNPADVDAGYSMLPNNVVRFINYTDYTKHPMNDDEFFSRITTAIQRSVPDLLDQQPDGTVNVHQIGWQGGASDNDWQKDTAGHGYDEARQVSSGSVSGGGNQADVTRVALGIRTELANYTKEFKEQQGKVTSNGVKVTEKSWRATTPYISFISPALVLLNKAEPGMPKPLPKVPIRNEWVHKGAEDYVKKYKIANSLPSHGYAPLHTDTSRKIADEYDKMPHQPNHPAVKEAYHHLVKEVGQQYDHATKQMGMKFEPWKGKGEPYKNSEEMRKDVTENHHLNFFTGGDMPKDHPLAGVDPKTGLSHNDKFRAIHDLFGHAHGGFEFGPRGEENAWIDHRKMFSDKAIPALTSETRGQNSWVNFGKHLRSADGSIPKKGEEGYKPPSQRPFAQQKAGLLPKEFHSREDVPARDPFKPKKIG